MMCRFRPTLRVAQTPPGIRSTVPGRMGFGSEMMCSLAWKTGCHPDPSQSTLAVASSGAVGALVCLELVERGFGLGEIDVSVDAEFITESPVGFRHVGHGSLLGVRLVPQHPSARQNGLWWFGERRRTWYT